MLIDCSSNHSRQHAKPSKCSYCTKASRRKDIIKRHERTHTNERPFACGFQDCGRTFARLDSLKKHTKAKH